MRPPESDQLTLDDADHAASFAWRAVVDEVIAELAAGGQPFTAETVRERLRRRADQGDPDAVGVSDAHPNAIGARFSAASNRGAIVCVGVANARRKAAHGRLLRQWVGVAP